MGTQVSEALDALRGLGTPAEIRALADRGYGAVSPPRVNAHIHLPPNFSAFDSVEQARDAGGRRADRRAGRQQLLRLQRYGEFVERARTAGIFPLFGLEIIAMQSDLRDAGIRVNDPGNPGKTYLCGKGITRFDDHVAGGQAADRRDSPQRLPADGERWSIACAARLAAAVWIAKSTNRPWSR